MAHYMYKSAKALIQQKGLLKIAEIWILMLLSKY